MKNKAKIKSHGLLKKKKDGNQRGKCVCTGKLGGSFSGRNGSPN